jgi:hypothetical protein
MGGTETSPVTIMDNGRAHTKSDDHETCTNGARNSGWNESHC